MLDSFDVMLYAMVGAALINDPTLHLSFQTNGLLGSITQLAAAGLSNRDIAQHMFITTRTVEGHLTHAYQKLAITSREQLPAALAPP